MAETFLPTGRYITTAVITGDVLTVADDVAWVRDLNGKEHAIKLASVGLMAREGHQVSVVIGHLPGVGSAAVLAGANHTTQEHREVSLDNDSLPPEWLKTFGVGKAYLWLMLIGFILGASFGALGVLLGNDGYRFISNLLTTSFTAGLLGAGFGLVFSTGGGFRIFLGRDIAKFYSEVGALALELLKIEVDRFESAESAGQVASQ